MKINAYIRTVSVCGHDLTILWEFPDSVHLQNNNKNKNKNNCNHWYLIANKTKRSSFAAILSRNVIFFKSHMYLARMYNSFELLYKWRTRFLIEL